MLLEKLQLWFRHLFHFTFWSTKSYKADGDGTIWGEGGGGLLYLQKKKKVFTLD